MSAHPAKPGPVSSFLTSLGAAYGSLERRVTVLERWADRGAGAATRWAPSASLRHLVERPGLLPPPEPWNGTGQARRASPSRKPRPLDLTRG